MKILLVQPPMFLTDAPPLGLVYLGTFLKKKGKDVEILDINIELYHGSSDEVKKYWHSTYSPNWYFEKDYLNMPFLSDEIYDKYADMIIKKNPEILGFSFTSTTAFFTKELIKRIKKELPNVFIVLGGPSAHPNLSENKDDLKTDYGIEKFVDAFLIGESEETLLDLVKQYEKKGFVDNCPGTYIKKEGTWKNYGLRKPIKDLNMLPFPDYDMVPRKKYDEQTMIRIMTSRGCYSKCYFCTDTYLGVYHRFRDPKDIMLEFRLRKAQGYTFLEFNDSTLNGNIAYLNKLCDLIIESGIGVKWGGSAKIRPEMTKSLLRKMRNAGCERLTVGIESGSQKVLDSMNKQTSIQQIEQFLIDCKDVGIKIDANWIVGFPSETEKDFEMTLNFLKKYHKYIRKSAVSTYFVNRFSYMEDHPEKFGIRFDHMKNWEREDHKLPIEERFRRFDELTKLGKDLDQGIEFYSPPRKID